MPYPELMVKPMREELTRAGVRELRSAQEVDDWMADRSGSGMLVVNSVCGCAAGMARPGVLLALGHDRLPDRVATVFAGQDLEATARARSHFADLPPSSPSIALFQGGELIYFIPRHRIESRTREEVAADLVDAFDRFLTPVGPTT